MDSPRIFKFWRRAAQLERIERRLLQITNQLENIMALLDTLQAQVERNTSVTGSAVALLRGLKTQLDQAGTDPAKVKALSDALGAQTDALAAAVSENTPAEGGGTPGTPINPV